VLAASGEEQAAEKSRTGRMIFVIWRFIVYSIEVWIVDKRCNAEQC